MWFSTFLELLYPSHCVGCGIALFEESSLCTSCWNQLPKLSEYYCPICDYSLPTQHAHCDNCTDRKLHFLRALSAFRYDGLVVQLLSRFKYAGDQSLKKVMGELISHALSRESWSSLSLRAVVPVPLHPRREREREFNQARLLAQEVASRLQLPLEDLLSRIKATSTQVHSHRKERIDNLRDAFIIKKKIFKKTKLLSGNYLLVDDVLTTGSTLDECAKVLLSAGAQRVWAVTVARSYRQ